MYCCIRDLRMVASNSRGMMRKQDKLPRNSSGWLSKFGFVEFQAISLESPMEGLSIDQPKSHKPVEGLKMV